MSGDIREEIRGLIMQGAFESARSRARGALVEKPNDPALTVELSISLVRQCRFACALPLAIGVARNNDADEGDRILATNEIIVCASQLGMPAVARSYIRRLGLAKSGEEWRQRLLSSMLQTIGDNEAALDALTRPDITPVDSNAAMYLGIARKSVGDSAGEEDYLTIASRRYWENTFIYADKLWQNEPLEGKRLLIAPQGGVGDFIHYCRYIPALRRRGAHVVAGIPTDLVRGLIESMGPDETNLMSTEEMELCDYWLPIFGAGLPLTPEERNATVPSYATAPASPRVDALVAEVRARAAGRKCIALNWQTDSFSGANRSIPTATILPLFDMPDVHWVIFQRGCGLRQLESSGLTHDCSLAGVDLSFDEAGAVLTQIDGLLTIDCYAFHLAGALGVRAWMLASRGLDARHLNRERASVLYPHSGTLARQPTIGDWSSALAIAMREIETMQPV